MVASPTVVPGVTVSVLLVPPLETAADAATAGLDEVAVTVSWLAGNMVLATVTGMVALVGSLMAAGRPAYAVEIVGGAPALTESVNDWLAFGTTPLAAVMVRG